MPPRELDSTPGEAGGPDRLLLPQALDWLLTSPIVRADGSVLSWLNPDKPGYVYPEIMGYYASLCAFQHHRGGEPRYLEAGRRTAERMISLLSPRGALGRRGIDYAFDTAIGLAGLLNLERSSPGDAHREAAGRMAAFLAGALKERVVAFGEDGPRRDPGSWSHEPGASTLKTAAILHRAAALLGEPEHGALAEEVVDEVVEACHRGGRFRIHAGRDEVYAHAHCYAAEGLLYLRGSLARHGEALAASAAWLASRQDPGGGLCAWHDRPGESAALHGDATAQAARIWLCVDRAGYAENVARAMRFLRGLQGPEGGLVYCQGSRDLNSWVTMFACQAAGWLDEPAEEDWIL